MSRTPDQPSRPGGPPISLTVAASLVALEAIAFGVLAVTEALYLEGQKAVMGATTAVFFLAYGAGLALCSWALWRLRSWARAPVVVAQLIQLFVAWSFRGGQTTWVAVALAVVAGVVLAGVFHPRSIEALAEES